MTFICERSVPAKHVLFSGLPVTPWVRTWLRVAGQSSCGLKYGGPPVPFTSLGRGLRRQELSRRSTGRALLEVRLLGSVAFVHRRPS